VLQSVLEGDVVDRKDPANQANTAMNMTESPILRIRGLNKTYGKFTALHDIDIDVPGGEFLTIVGPSGSGKTTLIKLLVGMEDQTRGEIWLRDQRLDIFEPLSALDFRLRKTLEKELKALHERTGKTFVYITHSLEEAMIMSDRIAILREGRFEQIGPAAEIYSKPRSRFVASFMGDVNLAQR